MYLFDAAPRQFLIAILGMSIAATIGCQPYEASDDYGAELKGEEAPYAPQLENGIAVMNPHRWVQLAVTEESPYEEQDAKDAAIAFGTIAFAHMLNGAGILEAVSITPAVDARQTSSRRAQRGGRHRLPISGRQLGYPIGMARIDADPKAGQVVLAYGDNSQALRVEFFDYDSEGWERLIPFGVDLSCGADGCYPTAAAVASDVVVAANGGDGRVMLVPYRWIAEDQFWLPLQPSLLDVGCGTRCRPRIALGNVAPGQESSESPEVVLAYDNSRGEVEVRLYQQKDGSYSLLGQQTFPADTQDRPHGSPLAIALASPAGIGHLREDVYLMRETAFGDRRAAHLEHLYWNGNFRRGRGFLSSVQRTPYAAFELREYRPADGELDGELLELAATYVQPIRDKRGELIQNVSTRVIRPPDQTDHLPWVVAPGGNGYDLGQGFLPFLSGRDRRRSPVLRVRWQSDPIPISAEHTAGQLPMWRVGVAPTFRQRLEGADRAVHVKPVWANIPGECSLTLTYRSDEPGLIVANLSHGSPVPAEFQALALPGDLSALLWGCDSGAMEYVPISVSPIGGAR